MCMHCLLGEVKDVREYHWMMRFTAWSEGKAQLIGKVNCLIDVPNSTDEMVADYITNRVCTNCQLMKAIEVMRNERFEQ